MAFIFDEKGNCLARDIRKVKIPRADRFLKPNLSKYYLESAGWEYVDKEEVVNPVKEPFVAPPVVAPIATVFPNVEVNNLPAKKKGGRPKGSKSKSAKTKKKKETANA